MIGVETLIVVVGQLIGLVKARKEYKEDVFSTFVEPLYVETEKVIGDYLQIFQNAIDAINQGQNYMHILFNVWGELDENFKRTTTMSSEDFRTRRHIADRFDKDRQNLYQARAKVMELAEVYSKSNLDDDIKEFAATIVDVFNVTTSQLSWIFESRTTVVSEKLRDERIVEEELLKLLEQMVKDIRVNWEQATKKYAQLRIQSKHLR